MKKVFNSNALKLIACFSMVFDHIGKAIYLFFPNDTTYYVNFAFSIIGRLALPIFIFLIIEGFTHTKNIKNYFFRLGIMAIIVGIFEIIFASIPSLSLTDFIYQAGNIFIDLILVLLALYLFNNKDLKIKVLSILPIIYFIIAILFQNDTIYIRNDIGKAFLSAILPQYALVSPIIIVLYILIKLICDFVIHQKYDEKVLKTIDIDAFNRDVRIKSYIIAIGILSLLMYLLTYFVTDQAILNTDCVVNTYFLISIIFIYFYNGKLGKTNIYIKSAYYLFYPVHLGIIFLITYLISLL